MKLDEKEWGAITKAILDEQKKQQAKLIKEKRDKRLRNTALLLKHYHKLKRHCETIVNELEVYEDSVYDPYEINLNTLMKYKTKTAKMLDYFDISFDVYRKHCKDKGESIARRCDVIHKSYILNPAMKKIDIATLYGVDERTIRRDETKAVEELSIILFGIDSLTDFASDS